MKNEIEKIEVKVINLSDNPLPTYAKKGDAGCDVRAHLAEAVVIPPSQWRIIPTGLKLELPEGTEVQIRPRSGLACKQGITMINGIGTIDCGYRGELGVALINFSDKPFTISNGDRIAQLVVSKVYQIAWKPSEALSESERGSEGFGSTGRK